MKRLKVNDNVIVTAGKDKGKTGKVLSIKEDRIVVEGVNIAKKHVKPSAQNETGGIFEVERALHISNVMPVDPKTKKGTRVGITTDKNGNKQRTSKKSNEKLD